ncbi:hypothetical protein BJF90_09215 [Pseudonocardia sp. CNS-004]|nr:hypothetical protein BJF90_09215 [Pseudonocardia sp. CNS-004]
MAFEENVFHSLIAVKHKIWRSEDGWRHIAETWSVAERLAAEIRVKQDELNRLVAPSAPQAPPTALPDPSGRAVITDGGNPVGIAASSRRGLGHRKNEDAMLVGRVPGPSGAEWWYVIGADGLSSARNADRASQTGAAAARDELRRAVPDRTPEEAVRDAFGAAVAAVAALGRPDASHPPATTLIVAVVTRDATGSGHTAHLAWAGDTTARWVPERTVSDQLLTAPDLRTGALTRWIAADNRAEPHVLSVRLTGPGTLLVATDGLDPVDSMGSVVDAAGHGPENVVEALIAASHTVERADDRTVGAMRLPVLPATAPAPSTPTVARAGSSAPSTTTAPPTSARKKRGPTATVTIVGTLVAGLLHVAMSARPAAAATGVIDALSVDLLTSGALQVTTIAGFALLLIVVVDLVRRHTGRVRSLLPTWRANRLFHRELGSRRPEPNATVRDLADLLPGNRAWKRKKRGASDRSDADLLGSVFAPTNGQFMATHPGAPGLFLQGNHRRRELLRRAGDPGSTISWDTPIFIHHVESRRRDDAVFVSSAMRYVVLGVGLVLQLMVLSAPELRNLFPRPFDVFAHVGNLVGSGLVAVWAVELRLWQERRSSGADHLTRSQLHTYFRRWLPGILSVVALLNLVFESAWGLNVLGYRIFSGTVPDPWDLVYGVGFTGTVVVASWQRDVPARNSHGVHPESDNPADVRAAERTRDGGAHGAGPLGPVADEEVRSAHRASVIVWAASESVPRNAADLDRARGPPSDRRASDVTTGAAPVDGAAGSSQHSIRVVAFDAGGRPIRLDPDVLVTFGELLGRLEQRGALRSNAAHLSKASPAGLWADAGLSYAYVDGDAEIREVLTAAGLGSSTVVYLLDVPSRRVIVSLRTSGDVLDRAESAAARALLEQVVVRLAEDPDAAVESLWRGLDAASVVPGMMLARLAAADTLLAVLEFLGSPGEATSAGDIEKLRGSLGRVEQIVRDVGEFLEQREDGSRPELVQVRSRRNELRQRLGRIDPGTDAGDDPGRSVSGPVVSGRWWAWQRALWERALPRLARRGTRHPASGDRPAVLEVPLDLRTRAWLLVIGQPWLARTLVGYYWADRDAVVVFGPTLARLRDAGLLERLMAHETEFHREGKDRNRDGLLHDEDAAQTVVLLAQHALEVAGPRVHRRGVRRLTRQLFESRPRNDDEVRAEAETAARIRAEELLSGGVRLRIRSRAWLAGRLRRSGMTRDEAAAVAGKVWAFGGRDARGRDVITLIAERMPAMRAAGRLADVVEHVVFRAADGHVADPDRLIADITAGASHERLTQAGDVPGLRARLPVAWRGGQELRALFAGIRPLSKDLFRAGAALMALERAVERAEIAERRRGAWRWLRPPPSAVRGMTGPDRDAALQERRVALADAIARRDAATERAVVAALRAGFGRRDIVRRTDVVELGLRRFMTPVAGFFGAIPGQATSITGLASFELADHIGRSESYVTSSGANVSFIVAGVGLATSGASDRLVKNMAVIATTGLLASIGLAAVGLTTAAWVFPVALTMVGLMGWGGALLRGRIALHWPTPEWKKDARDAQYESSFRFAQVVVPVVIMTGISVADVPTTVSALTAMVFVVVVAAWALSRGVDPTAPRRQPQSVWKAVRGGWQQLVGTPYGWLHPFVSIPLLAAFTGYFSFAGGALLDQMVLLSDPNQRFAAISVAGLALILFSRVVTFLTGLWWEPLKKALGRTGAIRGMLRLRSAPPGPVSERAVLWKVPALGVTLLIPVWWLAASPSLPALFVHMTVATVVMGWAWTPLPRWNESAKGNARLGVGKGLSLALGTTAGTAVLGGFAPRVAELVALGAPYAHLVDAAHLRLALLTTAVVLFAPLYAYAIGRLRIGTLDELGDALRRVGATPAQSRHILASLGDLGLWDIGVTWRLLRNTARPRWRPAVLAGPRLRAGAARVAALEARLATHELDDPDLGAAS